MNLSAYLSRSSSVSYLRRNFIANNTRKGTTNKKKIPSTTAGTNVSRQDAFRDFVCNSVCLLIQCQFKTLLAGSPHHLPNSIIRIQFDDSQLLQD